MGQADGLLPAGRDCCLALVRSPWLHRLSQYQVGGKKKTLNPTFLCWPLIFTFISKCSTMAYIARICPKTGGQIQILLTFE